MATRQQRIDEFTHDGAPPADQPLEILCEDHVGTYLVPFPCRWTGDDWTNADTGEPIEVAVVGWRAHCSGTAGAAEFYRRICRNGLSGLSRHCASGRF